MSSNFRFHAQKILKPYAVTLSELDSPELLNQAIKLSLDYLQTKKCPPETIDNILRRLQGVNSESFYEIFAAVLQLTQLTHSIPQGLVKEDEFRTTLIDLKLNPDYVNLLNEALVKNRPILAVHREPHRIQWRINIATLNESQPTIVLRIVLKSGEIRHFVLSLIAFHKLRFTLATLLNEMLTLRERPLMKK